MTDDIEFYTVDEWEERFDELFARVENGEIVGIYDLITGDRAVIIPVEEYERLMESLNDLSPPT